MESIERTSCYDTEEDIKPKGFEIISLGDEIKVNPSGLVLISNKDIEDTTDQTIQLLIDQYIYEKCIEHNFELGKKYFGYEILKKHLNESINWATRALKLCLQSLMIPRTIKQDFPIINANKLMIDNTKRLVPSINTIEIEVISPIAIQIKLAKQASNNIL